MCRTDRASALRAFKLKLGIDYRNRMKFKKDQAKDIHGHYVALLICIAGFVVMGSYYFPGYVSHDAEVALASLLAGSPTDWHSPYLAVWLLVSQSILPASWDPAIGPTLTILGPFWTGLYLMARRAAGIGWYWGVAIALIGWFPPLFMSLAGYGKDTALVALFTLALGCIYTMNRRRPLQFLVLILVIGTCLTLGVTIRTNAIFAVVPILFLVAMTVGPKWLLRYQLVATLILWLGLLGISQFANYAVFDTKRSYSIQYVLLSDIFAMNYVRGEFLVPEIVAQNTPELTEEVFRDRHTLTPLIDWALWGNSDINMYQVQTDEEFRQLRDFWIERMWSDPVSYIQFKFRFFDSLMSREGQNLFRQTLFQGWWYLILLTVGLLIFSQQLKTNQGEPVINKSGLMMALSGLFYLLPYTLLQGGAGFRFLLWGVVASALMGVCLIITSLSLLRRNIVSEQL